MSSSIVIWMIILTVSLSATVLSAAAGKPEVLMAMTGLVSLVIAIMAIREDRALRAAGASRAEVAASTARYMGLIWTWGALGLLIVYKFILIEWKEWWHFFLMFAGVAVLSLFFAATLSKDAQSGKEDETMLRLGRALTWAQLIGMGLTVVGLIIDPNKSFMTAREPDWAANNIFFYGALALAAISANAILVARSEAGKTGT